MYFPDMKRVKGDIAPDMNIKKVLKTINAPVSSAILSINLVTKMTYKREITNAIKHDFRYLVDFIVYVTPYKTAHEELLCVILAKT